MRDNYTTSQLPLSLTFANGITQPPVNTNTFTPSSGSTPAPGAPFVLAATGDGASGENEAGAVTDVIAGWNPNLFIYLGDVYEKGTQTEFYNWYGTESTFFGRFKSVTNPVVGNHEFENGVALGYFDYWDNVPSNYSYNANGWHFITLDSNSAGVTSQQYEWLVADLAAHSEICTIASYHHPSFNVGPQGDTPRMDPIWRLLVQNGVDIVLTGHDHNYQRWLPLDENGVLSAGGVTQFVAGGGGHGLRGFTSGDSRLAIGFDTAPNGFGSLRFVLNPDGAAFQYVNLTGSVVDSGVIPCRGAPQDLAAPTQPTSLAADVGTGIKPVLSWNASSDNTGVANYLIFRDGQPLTTVEGWKTSYVDLSALLATTYTYQVVGRDLAGNSSAASLPASITTPGSGTMRFLPSADTYVNAAQPEHELWHLHFAAQRHLAGQPDLSAVSPGRREWDRAERQAAPVFQLDFQPGTQGLSLQQPKLGGENPGLLQRPRSGGLPGQLWSDQQRKLERSGPDQLHHRRPGTEPGGDHRQQRRPELLEP